MFFVSGILSGDQVVRDSGDDASGADLNILVTALWLLLTGMFLSYFCISMHFRSTQHQSI